MCKQLVGLLVIFLCSFSVLAKPSMVCFDNQAACNQNCIAKGDMKCLDRCTAAAEACVGEENAKEAASRAAAIGQAQQNKQSNSNAEASGGDKVGALAIDRNNGYYYGWSFDMLSLADAENRALAECKNKGGNCSVVLTWSGNGCGAYRTVTGNVGTAYGWGVAQTKTEADSIASEEALKRSNGNPVPNFVYACNSKTQNSLNVLKNIAHGKQSLAHVNDPRLIGSWHCKNEYNDKFSFSFRDKDMTTGGGAVVEYEAHETTNGYGKIQYLKSELTPNNYAFVGSVLRWPGQFGYFECNK